MKFRAVASIALAAALAAGLSGCNLISPQRTTLSYNASDGVALSVSGIDLRNALFISDNEAENDSSQRASLVVAVVNTTGKAGELQLEATSTDGAQSASVTLPFKADDEVQPIGYGEGEAAWFEGLDFQPGGAVNLTVTGPDGSSQTVLVPVLDTHGLAEYSTLIPEQSQQPAQSGTPGASNPPEETGTPGETGTSTPAETAAPEETAAGESGEGTGS